MRPLIDRLATPHPTEKALRVWVPSEQITPGLEPTAEVTLYREFKLHPATNRAGGYADYVFKTCAEGERFRNENGVESFHIPYLFVKVRSPGELAVPFEEFAIQRDDFDWPRILEEFKIYADDDDPEWPDLAADRQAYVFILRKRTRPPYRGATTINVRRYWSHRPFTEAELVSAPIQSRDVEYDLMVLRGIVKDCIGPAVKVPGLAGDGGAGRLYNLSDATPSGTEIAAYPARNYAATNYTTWEDHVYLMTQEPTLLGYIVTEYEAIAPELTAIES